MKLTNIVIHSVDDRGRHWVRLGLADFDRLAKMCGCLHPLHIGLVCGYPIGLTPHAVNCECEG
jgi:hypothetical protein